jgi:hypothetical protein
MDFLEDENKRLLEELQRANEELALLRDENL